MIMNFLKKCRLICVIMYYAYMFHIIVKLQLVLPQLTILLNYAQRLGHMVAHQALMECTEFANSDTCLLQSLFSFDAKAIFQKCSLVKLGNYIYKKVHALKSQAYRVKPSS